MNADYADVTIRFNGSIRFYLRPSALNFLRDNYEKMA